MRCDLSRKCLRKNINTYIMKKSETNHQHHIVIHVVIALHLEILNDMNILNEHGSLFLMLDVKLFVTEVLIPINSVERFGEKMGTAHLSSFFTVTSPPSCTCMVVETKAS